MIMIIIMKLTNTINGSGIIDTTSRSRSFGKMRTVSTANANLAVVKWCISSLCSPSHFVVSYLEQLNLFPKKALIGRQAYIYIYIVIDLIFN